MFSPAEQVQEGWRLHRSGEFARAADIYAAVLRADPDNADALYLFGFLHGQHRNFEQAQYFIGEAIKRNIASPDAFVMRGFALKELGRYEEALACFDAALALNPEFREALLDRAALRFRMRRYEEAAADYERLLVLDPEYPDARGNALFSRLHSCDWRGFDEAQAKIREELEAGKRVIAPFDAKALGFNPEDELRCARIWAADQCPAGNPLWRGERYAHERIRLAYVSADFHAHAMASLMAGVFERHDRKRFEAIAISLGPDDGSPMRLRLTRAFERFIDVRGKSETEIAHLMRELEVDIAIDLMGFTEGCRPRIFAVRPAPVQVNYLGYPGSMGADYMDYLIADKIAVPEKHHLYYAERIATLPHAFMPMDDARVVSPRVFRRSELGLPDDGFVFCCFNTSYKLTPRMFGLWMRLLRDIPDSVLWLGQASELAVRNLKREAEARGIAPARLVFAGYIESPADHLARLRAADLFLDTVPYNAHATAADALWAGLPVLTCMGESFAGRVAASLLDAARLPELVTESLEEYERIALALARDAKWLGEVRSKLNEKRATAPLFDTLRFTRNLENAYVTMWERRQSGLAPASFAA